MQDTQQQLSATANARLLVDLVNDLSAAIAGAGGDEHRIAVAEYAFQRNLLAIRSAREHSRRLAA